MAAPVGRGWTAETVSQMLHRFKQHALLNTHSDFPELRLRVAKLNNSTVLLAIVDHQGQLMEVHEYSELQPLPQRLQAQIAALAIDAQTKTSQPFRDPLLPKELASKSNQPSQSQTAPVFPASKHAAASSHTSSVVPTPPHPFIATPAHEQSTKVPAVSRPYAASPDLSNSGTLPNELVNAGECSRSASPVPPSSSALTPRAGSLLPQPRDAPSSSVLEGPRTPSHANKHTLARDVLRALGFSGKRGREGDSENEDERAPKKRVIDDSSSVSTTNSTSSIQAPVAITGTPMTSTIPLARPPITQNRQYTYKPYNPYRVLMAPSTQVVQPHNLTSTLPKAIPNTVPPGTQDLSTMAESRTKNLPSQTTTSLLPVGTTSAIPDPSAVEVMATPSSYPTLTQNLPLADKDAVAASTLEVSQLTGSSPIQNNNVTAPTSRSHSPIDDREGDAGSSKLPLFFRSSSTPLGDTSGKDDADHSDAEDVHTFGPAKPLSAKALGKRKIPYVLIPPPPTWVKEFKARLERRRRNEAILEEASDETVYVGFESPVQQEIGSATLSLSITDTLMTNLDSQRHSRAPLLGLSLFSGYHLSSYSSLIIIDEKEEAAMQKCSSRLREAPCKWRDCDSILNCADKLYLHLQYHVEQNKAEKVHSFWVFENICADLFCSRFHVIGNTADVSFCTNMR